MLPIPLQPQQLVMRVRACAIPPLPARGSRSHHSPAGQSRSWKVTTMAHGAVAPTDQLHLDSAAGLGVDHPGRLSLDLASTAAGRRRWARPRLARDGAAGPGFNCRGTAPPGRASTGPGRRCRAGPRLARDGGRARPIRRARLRGLANSQCKRLWNECDGPTAGGTARQYPESGIRTREFGAAGRGKLCTLEQQ
jgi:hypothetical protein